MSHSNEESTQSARALGGGEVTGGANPFGVTVSFTSGQVGMWMDGVPVHGDGDSYEAAEEDFLDALVEYAEAWRGRLQFAVNHRANADMVERVLKCAGDRGELRRMVLGDE